MRDASIPATLALLRQWAETGECLGGQVFVWRDAQVLADLAVGRSGPSRAASAEDVGRLHCAVKPLTACCLARAVEAGEIGFDDPVSRFLPEFSADGRAAITLRQLLSHSSGLPDALVNFYEHGFTEVVRIACERPLPEYEWYREPRYNNNLAWPVLAAVIERVYELEFARVVADVVVRPAELPSMCITGPDQARYASCFVMRHGSFAAVAQPPHADLFGTVNPAHGGFGSARDLGFFYGELIRCATGGGRMLGRECTRELIRTQGVIDLPLSLGRRPYGLGFMTDVHEDAIGGNWSHGSFGHGGYVGRYRVVTAFGDVEHKVAVAIRLFSVGAKNNWRFRRLGAALSSDLQLAATGPGR